MEKNRLLFVISIFILLQNCFAIRNIIIVEFKDKGVSNSTIDKPVNENYIRQIEQYRTKYINSSKWLNMAVFEYEDVYLIEQLKQLSFVNKINFECQNINQRSTEQQNKFQIEQASETETIEETSAYLQQLVQLKGDSLQELGYKGSGIKIAVIDNGFPNANSLGALQHIYTSGRLKDTYDFYTSSQNVYIPSGANHGTNCFSIIGGLLSNFSGSAPDATFYLYRTEVDAIEGQSEEILLAQALERCVDSGINVASISLGYYNGFNDGTTNHSYADLDGKTTISAKAVNLAASKGMLVCVAAGNTGNSSWKYIITPADADSVFSVGGVDVNGNISTFTAYNFDTATTVRPKVSAKATSTSYINQSNGISTGNGTSYSTPIITGLSACLWQAFPSKTAWEVKTAIEQSAHLYNNPSMRLGYGIPNFMVAYRLLQDATPIKNLSSKNIKVYPNPTKNYIKIIGDVDIDNAKLFDLLGNKYQLIVNDENMLDISALPNNLYILQFGVNNEIYTQKIIKQ